MPGKLQGTNYRSLASIVGQNTMRDYVSNYMEFTLNEEVRTERY